MKMKKITASLLLAACTFACACGGGGGGSTDSSSSSGNGGVSGPVTGGVLTEPTNVHYVEGTLHDVNVDYDNPVSDFVANGKTNYTVVLGAGAAGKAAGYIVEHVYKATSVTIPMVNLSEIDTNAVNDDTQYIFVGCEEFFQQKGGEFPDYDTIGVSGYQIITVGKNVFINAYSLHGWQMGVLGFLRDVIGYEMFSEDCVIYERSGDVMPYMNTVERPDFDFRQTSSMSAIEQFGMGYTYSNPIIDPASLTKIQGESWCHNVYCYVSPESDEAVYWLSNDSQQWQFCFTSRGDKEMYKKFIYHMADKIIYFLKQRPECTSIIVAQHDTGSVSLIDNCKCTACMASYDYYGTFGGAWLSLLNRASVVVDEWLQTQEAIDYFGGVKDWNLLQLVYHNHVNPPIEKTSSGYVYDENGHGVPLEEKWFDSDGNMWNWDEAWAEDSEDGIYEEGVVADWSANNEKITAAPHVQYFYATSAADWTHSYYDSQNSGWKQIADGWAGVNSGNGGGKFFIWAYALNSRYLLYPYNSFDSSFESTRYFKSLGAGYMFWQTQYQNPKNAGWSKLRNYLDSKVEFDVNVNYQDCVNRFFKYYFGAASEQMQRFFEECVARSRYNEIVNQVSGNIHNTKLGYAANWPEGLLNSWMDLISEAYDVIEQEYRISDPEKYAMYKEHILMEELFPRYAICTTYATSYDADTIKAMRLSFLDDFYALGNKYNAEGGLITNVTAGWDLD